MIIIGYQGIGKSSVALKNNKFIDLESSNFFVDGERDLNWDKVYCNIANHLSKQGFIVFTSSHYEIRKHLLFSDEEVWVVFPDLELKQQWLKRLEDRYNDTGLMKDKRALDRARDHYEEDIRSLIDSPFHIKQINDIHFNLEELILGADVPIGYEECKFCKYKREGDSFHMHNDCDGGYFVERHEMQYCPKCGMKLGKEFETNGK